MSEGYTNLGPENFPGFKHKICTNDEETESAPLKDQREITITVESIENIDENKIKEVLVKMEFNGNFLNQSRQTPISDNRADIDLMATINAEDTNSQFLDEILSNPILFTVLDCTACAPTSRYSVSPTVSLDKETKKRTSKMSNSRYSGSKSFMANTVVLGMCNLDIGSFVTGEKRIKETLLVEPEKKLDPPEVVCWAKLPKLVVVATTGDEPLIPGRISKFSNVIGITIESIYNVPEYVSEGNTFDAIVPLPNVEDKTRRIKFSNGITTTTKDTICKKKWLNLPYTDGRGTRSKHSISFDTSDIISTLPENINLESEINKPQKIVQWNMWKNSLMFKNDVSFFCSKITKYGDIPVEILGQNKPKDQPQKGKSARSDKKSKPLATENIANFDHLMAFLNLSPLLYPGVSKIRVAAPLFTYSQADLLNKFGEEFSNSQSQTMVTNKVKSSYNGSKTSTREFEEKNESSAVPIFDNKGYPTFIVVEVELLKPFNPKRDLGLLEDDLRASLSLKRRMNKKISNFTVVQESFSQTIKDVVSIFTQEYQNFSKSFQSPENETEDVEIAFQKFLYKQENFYKIKTTLENKVTELINEKYGAVSQYKEKIPEIYVYLVNEIHKITNGCLIGSEAVLNDQLNNDDLQLYAEEAIEEGNYKLAEDYLLMKISRDTSNPNYWLDGAVYFVSSGRYETAIEAVREALFLDFHHQIGLLMYALLMGMFGNGSIAEITFEILLTKYPNFIEGWMALRLFYLIINNYEGGLIAYQEAKKLESYRKPKPEEKTEMLDDSENIDNYVLNKKCNTFGKKTYGMASFKNGVSCAEPLSWTITFCAPHSLNIKVAILLQKLGFYEYALMSLAQELNGLAPGISPPPCYTYYSAVNYYLQGRYEEAIPLLEDFAKQYGKDYFLWSLLGHCYCKLNNLSKAISYYEYVMESYNRPDDIHLVYLRMGFYYIQANKFSCAERILKAACKYSPTPKLWKGLGIAYLRLEEAEEAEIAFSEANYLDNQDPEVWAYLALANAMLRRLDLFEQCYSEAVKRDLENPDIIKEIKACALINNIKVEEF